MKILQVLLPSFAIFYQLQMLLLTSTVVDGQPIMKVKIKGTLLPPSSIYTVKLQSRKNLLFVSIDQNGKVSAVANCANMYTPLEIKTVGSNGLVKIKGVQSGRYLAMDSNGQIYSSKKATDETVFKRTHNSFETFASEKYYLYKYYDAFFAIKRNGTTKNAKKTRYNSKAAQFSVISATKC